MFLKLMLLKVNGFYHLLSQVIPLEVTSVKVLIISVCVLPHLPRCPYAQTLWALSACPCPHKNGSLLYTSTSQNVVQEPWRFPKTLSTGLQAQLL